MAAPKMNGISHPLHVKTKALVMLASGIPLKAVGLALSIPLGTIRHWMDGNKPLLDAYRQSVKQTMAESLTEVVVRGLDLASQATDSKEYDAATRGLLNAEKVSASISGENGPGKQSAPPVSVQIAVTPGWVKAQVVSEIKQLPEESEAN